MAVLYFIVRKIKSKEILLFSSEISKEVFMEMSKNLEKILESSDKKEKIIYSPAKIQGDTIEIIDFFKVKNYEQFSKILKNIPGPSISEIMDSSDSLKSDYEMWGYCYVSEIDGKKRLFFKKYKSQSLLKTNCLRMIFSNGHFTSVNKSIFTLDYDVDCFMENGVLYILKKNNFELLFDFHEEIAEISKKGYQIIKNEIKIECDGFEKWCEQGGTVARKLASIYLNKHYEKMKHDKISEIIEMHNLKIKYNFYKKSIAFDSLSKSRIEYWEILKLFDDDYLHSYLTNNLYESENKN
ncbi:Kiwa anti-phage protein KwaB-like domain-containing protein [Candidatus Cetobacterium colombiensis]|uniref:DUF4868 domain-containing protein n=1 Tax=Candidatus Cetobacterium colombiensis TaxID=3073100 RepID=A0ABU4WEE4_9FUSO|nr:Kiwa anti-phage protein KwaB-like domain-containing protein [Candidatus Cetobacterium colombiensis]MDX8337357.1 DUF4868 domain-containing protein [Candidatus Cetobacterium colombiensis]